MSARTVEIDSPQRYQFGSAATAGVWLGWGTSRVAALGAGLLGSVVMVTAGAPTLLAVLPVALGACLAAARVAGRPLLDWVSPVLSHQVGAATGTTGWTARFPVASTRPHPVDGARLVLPGEFGRIRLLTCPGEASIGLLVDRAAGTVTAVFTVAGVDRFALLEPEDRDGLVAGWAQSLSILADTDDALTRLQIVERAHPPAPAARAGDGSAGRDELHVEDSLVRAVEALATLHSSSLAVQWSLPRIDAGTLATVAGRCRGVSRSLLAGRLLTRPMSSPEIAGDLAVQLRGPQTAPAVGVPGPVSRRACWSHVRTDDTCHRSYAIAEWPTTPVTADWLAPLLLAAPPGVSRTVSIHLERLTPAAAGRVARSTRARAALDQRDRVRLGMTTSAAIDRAESTGAAMDEELAAGYRTHRLTGLVTLSGDSIEVLDDAARVLRQAASAARLDLRALHGQHDKALVATLPLCRVRSRGAGMTPRRTTRPVSVEQLQARLVTAVEDLATSPAWQAMLIVASRLPTYSPANVMLIAAQRPDATRVAGYRAWAQLGRQVRAGEHGIAILAPVLRRPSRPPPTPPSPPSVPVPTPPPGPGVGRVGRYAGSGRRTCSTSLRPTGRRCHRQPRPC